jgi:hypothetical protein
MYNSSGVSLYTPDIFSMTLDAEKEYLRLVSKGSIYAKQKRVIIATMLRDVEKKVPEIIKKAERVGKLFGDYVILIVENDSLDGTRERLIEWSRKNSKVSILGCGYNTLEKCHLSFPKTQGHNIDRGRIQKMVTLRNIYLNEIKRYYSDFDFVVMWDLDAVGSVYLDGIEHTLGYLSENSDVDVVCANGIYRWGLFTLFYDTYALLHKGEEFNIEDKIYHDIRKGAWEMKYQRGDAPVEVDSCFSGFAIYRTSSLVPDSVFYDMTPPPNIECEHVRLNKKIGGKKVMNPSMLFLLLLND